MNRYFAGPAGRNFTRWVAGRRPERRAGNFVHLRRYVETTPDIYLGEVAGVATNSKGDVFVFHADRQPERLAGRFAHLRDQRRDKAV